MVDKIVSTVLFSTNDVDREKSREQCRHLYVQSRNFLGFECLIADHLIQLRMKYIYYAVVTNSRESISIR